MHRIQILDLHAEDSLSDEQLEGVVGGVLTTFTAPAMTSSALSGAWGGSIHAIVDPIC
jgi:hypothetical protein